MPSLQWSEALSLDLPIMDDTHKEFVDMLASVEQTPDTGLTGLWDRIVAHTRDHFGREDDWMQQTHFASCHCHSGQHHVVLQVMEEIGRRAKEGELPLIRDLSVELGQWFSQHAQSMDAALALHMRRVGFDAVTGVILHPEEIGQDDGHGCSVHTGASAEEPVAA